MHAELTVLEVLLALEHHPLYSDAASELRAHRNPAQQRRQGESTRRELCKAETMRKAGAHRMSPHRGCNIITGFAPRPRCCLNASAGAASAAGAFRETKWRARRGPVHCWRWAERKRSPGELHIAIIGLQELRVGDHAAGRRPERGPLVSVAKAARRVTVCSSL